MPLLEVQHLTMRFGSLVANNDVSFHIDPGQIVGLIGPNGAGKTTLFNCIPVLPPQCRQVVFDDKDVTTFFRPSNHPFRRCATHFSGRKTAQRNDCAR